ncbi:MAG: hypothetical protein PHG67_14090 [Bacteroidales bacterium]|nr:hypothetical protein [Bacteroidales bacterium]HOI31731.1 hypothetical protein [Bacteroidales bacterium]
MRIFSNRSNSTLLQGFVVVVIAMFMLGCVKVRNIDIQHLGSGWKVYADTLDTLYQVKMPMNIFQLLHEYDRAPHYHAFEAEKELEALSKKTWIAESVFIQEKEILKHNNLILSLKGLNTYAKVELNNKEIYVADNMFVTHEIPVKGLLHDGQNKLRIVFPPQSLYPDSLGRTVGVKLPESRAFMRKAAYQWGWDWAPKIISPEISEVPVLKGWSKVKVNVVSVLQTQVDPEEASLTLVSEIEADQHRSYKMILLHQGRKLIDQNIHLDEGINKSAIDFSIYDPQLWWPAGYGSQPLYTFDIQLLDGNHVIYSTSKKIGLRSIEVSQRHDSIGQSFTFVVNGIPVYARGANYVPQDLFVSNINASTTRNLLQSAAGIGMNMIRVWGGGIYPSDTFYDLCDSLGLLVWQDFMFANTLYPFDTEFLANVKMEAEQHIKRLRDRTSLALWCGNNEVDEGFHNWGWENQLGWSVQEKDSLWQGYQLLFEQLLPDLVDELDPETFYWPSSPSTGWGRPESLLKGDVHYWGVWWGELPFEMYQQKVGRFNSEFGFQAMPSQHTLKHFVAQDQWYKESPGLAYYQKHPRGNELIQNYMKADFPVPERLEDYAYMSQLTQAYGVGMAVEAQRLSNGHSSGTLIWQLNDAWPVISWSMIDYFGRPKALYYHLKRIYRPVLIGVRSSKESLDAQIVNHGRDTINARMRADLTDFEGNVLHAFSVPVHLKPGEQKTIKQIVPVDMFQNIDKAEVWLKILLNESNRNLASYNYFFVAPKSLKLPEAEIYMHLMPRKEYVEIILKADRYIQYLELISNDEDGKWENNYFDLEPGETISIKFYPSGRVPLNELQFEKRYLNTFLN